MEKSLFTEMVDKWFGVAAKKVTETYDGEKEIPKFLHESMLTPDYSVDLKWDSSSIDGSIVAADVVAMDSPLPLKKRDSISRANGDVPKLGMKLYKGEKLITDIQIMAARGASEAQIAAKLFSDVSKCALGIKERVEMMFLQGISTGLSEISESENVGTAIRVDFGYLPQNRFGVAVKWGDAGYAPLSDIAHVIENAKDTITTLMMGKKAFNLIRNSEEGRELSANFRGFIFTDKTKLPTSTPTQFSDAFSDEYGVSLIIVDHKITTEKDGKRTSVEAFDENAIVFLSSTNVGRRVYSTLAEETNPVTGAQYEKVDDYILMSKYSKNDPLREFTASQAIVIPVIDNVNSIYLLETQEVPEQLKAKAK